MKHSPHPRRPSIGVTSDISTPSPESPLPRYELKTAYPEAVLRAGGLPFLLPFTEDRTVLEQYLDRVSGLVLTGGAFDITPSSYGEEPKPGLGQLKPERTNFELALLRLALQRKLPVLGICGGMQLINVAFKGTLIQDIATELPAAREHQQKHDRTQPAHPIEVKEPSLLAECVGKGQMMVNSTHHQAVKDLGPGLIATAHAPDGIVEAVEAQEKEHFVVGVQWHPELMLDTVPPNLAIYKAFIHRARERRH